MGDPIRIHPPEFSRKTVDVIGKRAAYLCSNPQCGAKTIGPNTDEKKATTIGEAAHIQGARPSSARYVPSMSDASRASITNAIWLCRNCHKMVDSDATRFPADLLFIWREEHEQQVTKDLGTRDDQIRVEIESNEAGRFDEFPPLVRRIVIDKPPGWEWQLTAELLRHLNRPVFRRMQDLRKGLYTNPFEYILENDGLDWFSKRMDEASALITPIGNTINHLNAAWGAPGEAGDSEEILHTCRLLHAALEKAVEYEERVRFARLPDEFKRLQMLMVDLLGSQADKLNELPAYLDEVVAMIGSDHGGTIDQPRVVRRDITFDVPDGWSNEMDRELKRVARRLRRGF